MKILRLIPILVAICLAALHVHAATTAPSLRTGYSVVWTGTDMIIWGGSFYNGFTSNYNDGWRYNPASNSWTPISTNGAPTARTLSTAVWTGTEMIVWGGVSNSVFPVKGGRYNPATDTWAPVSTTSSPGGREYHTAVWTGSNMIVWGGGNNGGTVYNDGGIYDPVADKWTATSGTSAPSARMQHVAVWTGSNMIVWGGGFANNTGGVYDPVANSWTAVSTTNEPAARAYNSAVWTGKEMIIWGGALTGPPYDDSDGGRYNPVSNTWNTAMNGNNYIPTARSQHTAVWTGTNMIVWGGNYAYSGDLNDGARYATNGSTSPWNQMTSINAPTIRSGHTAIWTGTEMIVWGGGYYYNDGGRYNPVSNKWTLIGFGGVHTAISPAAAVTAGAKWQFNGTNTLANGVTISNLNTGQYTVSFTPISGWVTPSNQTFTVGVNATNLLTATYVQLVPPVFQAGVFTNQTFSFGWSAIAGQKYVVQYKTDTASTNWTNLGGTNIALSSVMSATDPSPADQQRFYRVILVEP